MSPLIPMVIEQTSRGERVRHLLPLAERADHLPRHPRGRPDRQPDRGAAAPRVGGSGQGHLALHQLPRRLGLRRARDLRPDAVRQPDIQTICVGIAMSMGALLLAGGAEKRMALPNAKILIHQVSGGFQGQATDIEIAARETIALKRRLEEIISQHSRSGHREGLQGHGARLLPDRARSQRVRNH